MLAMLVLQVLLVPLAIMARMAKQVNLVPKVQRVLQAPLAAMVNLVLLVPLALLDHLARKVFARNIAPWTAAFSSRTAPGDKRDSSNIGPCRGLSIKFKPDLCHGSRGYKFRKYGVYCSKRSPAFGALFFDAAPSCSFFSSKG